MRSRLSQQVVSLSQHMLSQLSLVNQGGPSASRLHEARVWATWSRPEAGPEMQLWPGVPGLDTWSQGGAKVCSLVRLKLSCWGSL